MSAKIKRVHNVKEAGYRYVRYDPNSGGHILADLATGRKELWAACTNSASYRIRFKNTHLEFVRSILD